MSLKQEEPNKAAPCSDLDSSMSAIESLPNPERWLTYQECAKHLLVRYLVARQLVQEPLTPEECQPAAEECVAQNADGICFLFQVRGHVWDVILKRKESCRKAVERNPETINDAEFFRLDLSKPAKITSRDSDFSKK